MWIAIDSTLHYSYQNAILEYAVILRHSPSSHISRSPFSASRSFVIFGLFVKNKIQWYFAYSCCPRILQGVLFNIETFLTLCRKKSRASFTGVQRQKKDVFFGEVSHMLLIRQRSNKTEKRRNAQSWFFSCAIWKLSDWIERLRRRNSEGIDCEPPLWLNCRHHTKESNTAIYNTICRQILGR